MKAWSVCLVCAITVLCVTAIALYAVSKGLDGVIIVGSVAAIVGVPAVLITKQVTTKKTNGDKKQ